jgi:hypothetical protein
MPTPTQRPWAILLCKFRDDPNDPRTTRLSDLYAQWVRQSGQPWVDNNLVPEAASDWRTILELYETFFTPAGAGTFNAVRYWDTMSHGSIDLSGTRVFPCTIDMTGAEGAALAQSPGGAQYQNAIFQKAKAALAQQHGADWKAYFGVAVSFQSADYGAQGGWYDGGPGVYMDIRWVRNQGMAAWGQEMGHAFGLDHSRQQGSADDYQDMWDAMSTMNAFCYTPDANFGMRGIGVNAWNMRGRGWLDESRVWRPTNGADVSEWVVLRPLHRRDLAGWLAAEVPGIGTDSAYLVELRVPADFDSNIPAAAVLVHRFEGKIGQFLGTHSYLEQGAKGQVALPVGSAFEIGTAPHASVVVDAIDSANAFARVRICYSGSARVTPTVHVREAGYYGSCHIPPTEGGEVRFAYTLHDAQCMPSYEVLWNVTGGMPAPAARSTGPTYSVVMPDPSTLVTVSITVVFADGTTVTDSTSFHPISQQEATWRLLVCKLREERPGPIPWWRWDPEKIRYAVRDYSSSEVRLMAERAEQMLAGLREIGRFG